MNDVDNYKLNAVSVALVDDHDVVLEGLKAYMEEKGVGHVETFRKGSDLLSRLASRVFDVFIVDVELADIDATLLIDSIRESQPSAKVIVHTLHEEMWVVHKMAQKHVDGVLYKSGGLEQLHEALTTVIDGGQYYCTKFRKKLREFTLQPALLTSREVEVLKLLAQGYSTKEIGQQLYISENTVENHRKSLMRKLQARNVANMIINGITAGYLNPAEL